MSEERIKIIPETRDEWKDLARVTIPQLTDYGVALGVFWDENKAGELFDAGHYKDLWSMLNKFWEDLPNNSSIRHGPFLALCNLCSEVHCILKAPDDAEGN